MGDGTLRRIALNGKRGEGLFALVDDCDFEELSEFSWYLSSEGYAVSTSHRKGSKRGDPDRNINTSMHRYILKTPLGVLTDHEDRDRLNNQRHNLRLASYAQNSWNAERNPITGFIGVSPCRDGTDRLRVRVNGESYGQYGDAVEAAMVYDTVCRAFRDPAFALLNFPERRLPDSFLIPNFNCSARAAVFVSNEVGVSWFSPRKKWRLIIRKKTMGYFSTEADAVAHKRSLSL